LELIAFITTEGDVKCGMFDLETIVREKASKRQEKKTFPGVKAHSTVVTSETPSSSSSSSSSSPGGVKAANVSFTILPTFCIRNLFTIGNICDLYNGRSTENVFLAALEN
jgi:hypothetical protein